MHIRLSSLKVSRLEKGKYLLNIFKTWTWTEGGLKFETYPVQTFALKQLWTRFHSYFLENFVHKTDYKSDWRNLRKKLQAFWNMLDILMTFLKYNFLKFRNVDVGWSIARWKIFNLTFKTLFSNKFQFYHNRL